jgi:predicted Ser/Thr protein kinase
VSRPDTNPIPSKIGRYEILGSLGTGSMGAVYKGFDPRIKRVLAVKTIRHDLDRDSEEYRSFIERFDQEARISGALSHPGIVTLYDIGEENGIPFLAMEFIDGETLEAILARGVGFEPAKAVAFVAQIALALDYAHSHGVVHRDVKPANLLVFGEDRIKITDFGIAKLADTNLTRVGQVLGTPSYMAPEQAAGESLDGRSDIFSLGICAFEMLSGIQPFVGQGVLDIIGKLVHEPPQRPTDLEARGLVREKWDEVFGKVLAKQPVDRYQTADAFARALEACVAARPDVGGKTPAFVPAPAPPVRTIPPRVVVKDDTIPPKPTATDAVPTEPIRAARVFDAPAPNDDVTVVMEAGEVTLADEGEFVPETIALTPEAVASLSEEALQATATVESPLADVPTVLMTADEVPQLELPPTRKFAALTDPKPAPAGVRAPQAPLPAPRPVRARPAPPAMARPPNRTVAVVAVLGVALLFLVALVWMLYRFAGSPVPVVRAEMRVETDPSRANVTVNGHPWGLSPVVVSNLNPGAYDVKATLEGHASALQTVTISDDGADSVVRLVLEPLAAETGRVDIQSDPSAAQVRIDGEEVGETPLTGIELEPGVHLVVLSRSGYREWSGDVEIVAGKTVELLETLTRTPRPATPRPTSVPTPVETRPQPTPEAPEPGPEPEPEPTPLEVDTSVVYLANQVDQKPEQVSARGLSSDQKPKLRAGESVSVTVSYVVTEEGDVVDVRIIDTDDTALGEAQAKVIGKWKYKPAVKQGVPVKYQFVRKFTYRAG